jgi:hypothetical protein
MERRLGYSEESGRDELIWVLIHMCMEAMIGTSLYSYLYLKLTKPLCLSYYCLHLLFNKILEEGKGGGGKVRTGA